MLAALEPASPFVSENRTAPTEMFRAMFEAHARPPPPGSEALVLAVYSWILQPYEQLELSHRLTVLQWLCSEVAARPAGAEPGGTAVRAAGGTEGGG